MRQTLNAQHSTPNARFQNPDVARWTLGVGRWHLLDFAIAGIFIYAGALKVLDPVGFANDIDNYKLLPWLASVLFAFYLPWLEIFCGIALITRRFYLGGLSILSALVFIFIIASLIAKARGLDITCGCFGHASKSWSFAGHLALDLLLLVGLLALWIARATKIRERIATGSTNRLIR